MIAVGLTGGIGSGKTTVAKEFYLLGIPIYIADEEAKRLMVTSKSIKEKLINLLGKSAYEDGALNKVYIADKIFNDAGILQKMNDIVHPEVARHFKNWCAEQQSVFVIKEAAILFENGSYKSCDYVITVTAPKSVKTERLLKRDGSTIEKIEAVMKNQWEDEQRIPLSNFIIENVDRENTRYQVAKIHQQIVSKIRG